MEDPSVAEKINAISHPLVRDAVKALGGRVLSPSLTPGEWVEHLEIEEISLSNELEAADDAVAAAKVAGKPTLVLVAQKSAVKRQLNTVQKQLEIAQTMTRLSELSSTGAISVDLPDLNIAISCAWREK